MSTTQTMEPTSGPFFQVGGPVREGALYVARATDYELPMLLEEGQLCFVFAPRQMGKSSLSARAAQALFKQGIRCASIDLTAIGGATTGASEWFNGIIFELGSKLLGVGIEPAEFVERCGAIPHSLMLVRFLKEEVLAKVPGRIVIFIDEIDKVRDLPFSTDEFFAAIRAISISDDPNFRRLTFCLLGVAQPSDLIKRQEITPFNIGRFVWLNDFTLEEAGAFLVGLSKASGDARKLLRSVYRWTSGHPYMTQKLCDGLVKQPSSASIEEQLRVDALVQELFLQRGQGADINLATEARKFDRDRHTRRVGRMLELYGRLLRSEEVLAEGEDEVQADLLLTGMVAVRSRGGEAVLEVRNQIVRRFFDEKWLAEKQRDRPFAEALTRWHDNERKEENLLQGDALKTVLLWAESVKQEELSSDEHAFLRASIDFERKQEQRAKLAAQAVIESERAERAGERADAEKRGREQAESKARLTRRLLLVLLAVLAMMLGLLVVALQKNSEAQTQRAVAEAREANERNARRAEAQARRDAEAQKLVAQKLARSESAAKSEAVQARRDAEAQKLVAQALAHSESAAKSEAENARKNAEAAFAKADKLAKENAVLAEQEKLRAETALKEKAELERRLSTQTKSDGKRAAELAKQKGEELSALEYGIRAIYPSIDAQTDPDPEAYLGFKMALMVNSKILSGKPLELGQSLNTSSDSPHLLVDFDYDSSHFVGATRDGQIFWSSVGGGFPSRYRTAPICYASLRSGERTLVVLDQAPGSLRLITWQNDEFTEKTLSKGPRESCRAVSSGDFLGVIGEQGNIDVWNLASGAKVPQVLSFGQHIRAAAFGPGGAEIFIGLASGEVRRCSLSEAPTCNVINRLPFTITAMAVSRDKQWLSVGGHDGSIVLLSLTSEHSQLITIPKRRGKVTALAFSPTSKTLLLAAKDGGLMWNIEANRALDVPLLSYGGFNSVDTCPARAIAAFGSDDGRSYLSELPARGWLWMSWGSHSSPVVNVRFSPDCKHAVSMGMDGKIELIHLDLIYLYRLACRYLREQRPHSEILVNECL